MLRLSPLLVDQSARLPQERTIPALRPFDASDTPFGLSLTSHLSTLRRHVFGSDLFDLSFDTWKRHEAATGSHFAASGFPLDSSIAEQRLLFEYSWTYGYLSRRMCSSVVKMYLLNLSAIQYSWTLPTSRHRLTRWHMLNFGKCYGSSIWWMHAYSHLGDIRSIH